MPTKSAVAPRQAQNPQKSAQKQRSRTLSKSSTVNDLKVKIKHYAVSDEAPLPSLFSTGWPRNIYPYGHRDCHSDKSEVKDLRVLRVANQYLEVDILPDFGGH